ncbi:MAG: sigma-54 dependent transcriptional regulator [Acidobacteria bacterium]|nr:sigma-54 dependent transcriptional regulator [Acidobacteriota bacterium]
MATRCHGVLYLERRISSKPYTAAHERLAWHFSRQAARILTATSQTDDDTSQTQTLDCIALDLDRESIESALPASDAAPSVSFGSITLVGAGPDMAAAFAAIQRFADGTVPVLIQGETGTGKELVAGALHQHGARAAAPFVAVDCGALSDSLAESELFGHARGAFSGAHRDRLGLLRSAENGTLFLDEIGNLPSPVQLKLLRALESREVRPVGSDRTYPVAFRLVAATNSDLSACVTRREFRADLYHRLRGGFIQIPPLRNRPEDLEPLVAYLLHDLTAANDRPVPNLSPHAWHLLRRHDWPGNVRELKLALEVALQVNDGNILEAHDFHQSGIEVSNRGTPSRPTSGPDKTSPTGDLPLEIAGLQVPPKLEGRMLLGSMVEHGWDKAAAARAIGWSRQRLYRQLKAYEIPLRVTDEQLQELQSRVDELGLAGTGNGARPHSGC